MNVRIWKARASQQMGQLLPREQKKLVRWVVGVVVTALAWQPVAFLTTCDVSGFDTLAPGLLGLVEEEIFTDKGNQEN